MDKEIQSWILNKCTNKLFRTCKFIVNFLVLHLRLQKASGMCHKLSTVDLSRVLKSQIHIVEQRGNLKEYILYFLKGKKK